jgi:putative nucleotidyltransferase with HDIG domain
MEWIVALILAVTAVLAVICYHLYSREKAQAEMPESVRLATPAWEREGQTDLTAPIVCPTVNPNASPGAGELLPPPGARLRQAGSHEEMKASLLDDVANGLRRITPLPTALMQILHELNAAGSSARSISGIVATEPVLTAAVLRVVNSSFYGLQRRVLAVDEAVAYLGFSTVRAIVLRLKVAQTLRGGAGPAGAPGYDQEQLWLHSLAVSQIAEHLSRRVADVDPGLASTLGLLHDLGKIAINSQFPQQVARMFDTNDPGRPEGESFLARERRIFGADHAFIGAFVAARWELPDDLVECIRLHHTPTDPAASKLPPAVLRALLVVHVANQLAKYSHVYCTDMEIDIVPDDLLAKLGMGRSLEGLLTADIQRVIGRCGAMAELGHAA